MASYAKHYSEAVEYGDNCVKEEVILGSPEYVAFLIGIPIIEAMSEVPSF
jgi:hypothetical protein